jgi:hypothetical protein
MGELVPSPFYQAQVQVEQAATTAFEASEEIKGIVKTMHLLWIELAARLAAFSKLERWRDLDYESFEAYLREMEIDAGLSRRTVYRLIEVHEQLHVQRGIPLERLKEVPRTKIYTVMKAIRRGQVSVEQAFADAHTLSGPDLEIRYRGLASSHPGVPDTSTRVETEREPVPLRVCPTCGQRWP